MTHYIGSGPYCYANSLAMVLGEVAPPPAVIEVLTGSPFGFELLGGALPLFDPYGWDPDLGLDAALRLLGVRCERTSGGTAEEAEDRLRDRSARGPVLVGPVDMGLLLHQPGTPSTDGGDHFVVVVETDGGTVVFHDPHGHPYATLPVADFVAAWEARTVGYTDAPYVMRAGFVQERHVTPEEALRRSLPEARRWLAGDGDRPVPPGTLGGAEGLEALAARAEGGLDAGTRAFMAYFAVRVGARRLGDAAHCLESLGLSGAAAVAAGQSRLAGSLQHPLVTADDRAVAKLLRRLAPSYERLRTALASETG
ncbi:hypothetical protein K388_01168 [Streptomyces sp. KhCrAH-43]|uniref:hypothetical protein n=1 Tax=unclassified Streptomyces TaxID=2593676 RepID=UPI00036BEA1B|nr:hypothetical protein [Streptomyces sp. KhCrAH-43]MYS38731.1 hypothetical protein [Streptomyces sp. SID4920]MYX66923.1 hypothetical protein [Streptomyces sp. SID8373]RAJ68420.1 hypothetical protein K388_01168 [Streptomyces sp. KhCrAH-43]